MPLFGFGVTVKKHGNWYRDCIASSDLLLKKRSILPSSKQNCAPIRFNPMFSEEGFKEAIKLLAKLNNLPLDRAGYLMTLIGDTPEMAEDGKIIVRDDQDNEIARVDYPSRED